MIETLVETEREIGSNGSKKNVPLPDELRIWFECPDEWMRKQEILEMRNKCLHAEVETVIEYVKLLKDLAIYLAGKTDINPDVLHTKFFTKAEHHLPRELCKEISK